MDVTRVTSSSRGEKDMVNLVLSDAAGTMLPLRLCGSSAVQLASELLVQLAQLPGTTGREIQVVPVRCEFYLAAALPDTREIVAKVGPLAFSMGPPEQLKAFLSAESWLQQGPPRKGQ